MIIKSLKSVQRILLYELTHIGKLPGNDSGDHRPFFGNSFWDSPIWVNQRFHTILEFDREQSDF